MKTAFHGSHDLWHCRSLIHEARQAARTRAKLFAEGLLDRLLGIDTLSHFWNLPERPGVLLDGHANVPSPYLLLRSAIRPCDFSADHQDVFVDIGCGNGRALCYVSRFGVCRKCIGIELSAEFAQIASENARALHGKVTQIETRQADAALIDYSEGTVFYMANPFGVDTILAVLNAIAESLRVKPRRIKIIYTNPQCDLGKHAPWLLLRESRSTPFSRWKIEHWVNLMP